MATMNVSLPDKMKQWVENRIKKGDYSNTSDYVRDLIRRDQRMREQAEILSRALEEGENSGISGSSVDEIYNSIKSDV
jgi:antitoxin ParD1/3/4